MAIQAPPVNMIANPYVPDLGRIQANALNIKNARQQNQLNAKKLEDYETDKEYEKKRQDWNDGLALLRIAPDLDEKSFNKIWAERFPDKTAPKVKYKGEKVSFETEDGIIFEGEKNVVKNFAKYVMQDEQLMNKPQLFMEIATDAGITIKRETKAEKEVKPEYTPGQAAEKIASLEKQLAQVEATGAIDPTGLAILQAISPEMADEAMKNKGDTKAVKKAIKKAIAYIQQFEPRTAEDPLGLR